MPARIGQTHILARNTGTAGSPTWNPIAGAQDVTLAATADAQEISTRASRIREYLAGMLDFTVSFTLPYDTADDDYLALRDAFFNGTPLDLAVSDGPIATSGTQYYRFGFVVSDFSRSEPLNGAVTVNVELKPSPMTGVTPAFVTVA